MAFPTIFGALPSGNQPASLLDTMFSIVAGMCPIPCTATGTNALVLFPIGNNPTLQSYSNYNLFSFIWPATPNGGVTASFGGLASLPVYALDGVTQVGAGVGIIGQPAMLEYSSALNGGAGGFFLLQWATGAQVISPGIITPFGSTAAPLGWLLCNGQAVSRTTFSNLFAVVSTFWGPGDGLTTFNVPDLRGYFLRGLDQGAGRDPGRAFGSVQADGFQDHTHSITIGLTAPGLAAGGGGVAAGGFAGGTAGASSGNHGTETRPINVAVPFIIKT